MRLLGSKTDHLDLYTCLKDLARPVPRETQSKALAGSAMEPEGAAWKILALTTPQTPQYQKPQAGKETGHLITHFGFGKSLKGPNEMLHLADIRNREAFTGLYRAMRQSPKPAAFVGAGVSAEAGYPTWGRLLDRLHNVAFPKDDDRATAIQAHSDVLWRAEVYAKELGQELYLETFRQLIRPVNVKEAKLAAKVAKLGLHHYLTTNYDNVLENALTGEGSPPMVVDAQCDGEMSDYLASIDRADTRLVYLHGKLKNARPKSRLLLTESDYLERYHHNPRAERDLYAILSTRPLIFIGFSLNDPAWIELLRLFRRAPRPRHFAILPLSARDLPDWHAIREYHEMKYGIQPIFYIPLKSHAHLQTILEQLTAPEDPTKRLPKIGSALGSEPTNVRRALSLPIQDAEDPHRGRWKGPLNGDREVSAKVKPIGDDQNWFKIKITVSAKTKPFKGPVWIYVHPTFEQNRYRAEMSEDRMAARLTLEAYGAFTIGVSCDEGRTILEYDLANAQGATKAFKEN